jgi:hypothetical protein
MSATQFAALARTTEPQTMLRRFLALDAVVTGVNGVAYLVASGPLGRLLDVGSGLLLALGLISTVYAAGVAWPATRRESPVLQYGPCTSPAQADGPSGHQRLKVLDRRRVGREQCLDGQLGDGHVHGRVERRDGRDEGQHPPVVLGSSVSMAKLGDRSRHGRVERRDGRDPDSPVRRARSAWAGRSRGLVSPGPSSLSLSRLAGALRVPRRLPWTRPPRDTDTPPPPRTARAAARSGAGRCPAPSGPADGRATPADCGSSVPDPPGAASAASRSAKGRGGARARCRAASRCPGWRRPRCTWRPPRTPDRARSPGSAAPYPRAARPAPDRRAGSRGSGARNRPPAEGRCGPARVRPGARPAAAPSPRSAGSGPSRRS